MRNIYKHLVHIVLFCLITLAKDGLAYNSRKYQADHYCMVRRFETFEKCCTFVQLKFFHI